MTLSAGDLSLMRDTLEETLPGTAVIHAKTTVADGQGGMTSTYAASGTVDCRISPLSADEGVEAERMAVKADWVVTVPAETTVTETSRVVISSVTYEISAIRAPRSYELSRRLYVSEVD